MTLIEVETYLGEQFSGDSWEDILTQLKAMNFSRPQDLQELMTNIAERIKTAQGDVVAVGTYEDFGHELERVKFLTIIKE